VLVILAAMCGLLWAFRASVPFEIPLTASDAGFWAVILAALGAMAWLGSLRS
jgi:hypothetical protein